MKTHDKRQNEKGMVTVEATIALTTFLFAFLMIYSIITISRAQAKMQIALNNTAQEISQYSYIYGMTNLDGTLADFQESANDAKSDVNGLVKQTINVFEGIQTLGKDASSIDISNVNSMLNSWENISNDLKEEGADLTAIKQSIEEMAKDPQKMLFGMAKLIGSETLEVAKSRLIAEPVARALIKKHLKRSENDTAEAFCKSVGIVEGTYLGQTSCFNGIDFSNSTLFPYGSSEITLIATYKVKLLQLLPIDVELTITQSAATKGWLHGDKTDASAAGIVDNLKNDKDDEDSKVNSSVWNSQSINDRNKTIRTLELAELKNSGYVGVSGETYIQAYDESTNTFAMISMCNPVYGIGSVEEIDRKSVEDNVKRIVAQIKSATDNKTSVTVKENNSDGSIGTRQIDCSKTKLRQKIVLIVPEDAGVADYVKKVVGECGYSDIISVEAKYGTGFALSEK